MWSYTQLKFSKCLMCLEWKRLGTILFLFMINLRYNWFKSEFQQSKQRNVLEWFAVTSLFLSMQCFRIHDIFCFVDWCINEQSWWFSDMETGEIELSMRETWIFKANAATFKDCPCDLFSNYECQPHGKLQLFKVEWHVGRNNWNSWYENVSFVLSSLMVLYFNFDDVSAELLYHLQVNSIFLILAFILLIRVVAWSLLRPESLEIKK